MAKSTSGPWPVVEWSAGLIRLYDPESRQTSTVTADQAVHMLGSRGVILAISRRGAFVRTSRLPDAAKADVAKILQLQIDKLFPIGSSEAAIDFLQTPDRNGEGRLAIIAATPSETLARATSELRGLNIQRIVPTALGAMPLATALGEGKVAVVQEGTEGMTIDLIEDGLLKASRVVPRPATADEIGAEVHRSWAMSKMEPGPIAAAGGLVFDGADFSTPMSTLAALSIDPPDLDLEDPGAIMERENKKLRKAKLLAGLTWGLALLFAIALWDMRATAAADVAKQDKKWATKTKDLRDAVTRAKSKASKLSEQGLTLAGAFEPKQYLGDLAVVFTANAPKNLWLTGMTVERGKAASLRGVAMTHQAVTDYLETLGTTDRFRDIKLVYMNDGEIENSPIVNFSISMHVIGNFPLSEEMKTTGAKK